MTDKKESKPAENGYVFSLEVLIKGKTNGHALEKLTHLLNHAEEITDYRIVKGVNLGQVIEAAQKLVQDKESDKPATLQKASAAASGQKKEAKHPEAKHPEPKQSTKHDFKPLIEQIEACIANRNLVRLSIVKGKGVKLSIPCRILNYDLASGNITVYHVDEKKVYSFLLTEIDDLTVS